MKTNPQKINVYCTNYKRINYGKKDISPETFKESISEYDEKGNLQKEFHYTSENELENFSVNEYNSQNQLISTAHYDEERCLVQKMIYHYDNEGNIIKQDNCYGEDPPLFSTHFIYENGLLVRQDSYDDDQFACTEKVYSYDDKKQLIKLVEYDEDGQEQYVTDNAYDDDGLLITSVRNELLAKDRRTYHFEYENKRKIKDLIYDYDETLIAKVYYFYNENGDIVETEEEDLDSYRKTKYTFDGKLVIKAEVFDNDEKLVAWKEYEYDENGKIINIRNFIKDEVDQNDYRIITEYRYERIYS